ncbi:MAG: glycosyltransferase family 1 protein [Deinococcota bacterium]
MAQPQHAQVVKLAPMLIDATPLQSEHRLRGVGAYLRALIRALEAELTNTPKPPQYLLTWQPQQKLLPVLESVNIPLERTILLPRPHRPAQVYWLYNEVTLRYALLRTRPDVLFAPDFNGLVVNPFGSTVAVLHDLTELKLQLEANRPSGTSLSEKLSTLRWQAYYRKLRAAKHIITISESVKQDAARLLNLPAERLHVVYHGLDQTRYYPVDSGEYADHPPYFVNIGGRNDNKNQVNIIEGFASMAVEHPDVQLYFAGPWHQTDLDWLEQQAATHNLTGRIRHLGYVPDESMTSLYSHALGFVFPSLEEGFGLPVLEAMACGAPVITSNRSSLPEVAGDAGLLVNPQNPDEIANAMRQLAGDENLRHTLRDKGIARAKTFTWQRTAQETLEVIYQAQQGTSS